jgi:hypothetical protein
MPVTSDGYRYLLVVIESLSRWPELIPLKTQTAEELAEKLYSEVFARFGSPTSLLSDLGSNLTSKVMKCLCTMFQIKHLKTSSYHPASNAQCETYNKQILQGFRLYCENQHEWTKYLAPILYSYRSTNAVKSIKLSPFEVMYARQMRLPVDSTLLDPAALPTDANAYVKSLLPRLQLT